jgi:hypothetical protein
MAPGMSARIGSGGNLQNSHDQAQVPTKKINVKLTLSDLTAESGPWMFDTIIFPMLFLV